jgi:hypothetical protein
MPDENSLTLQQANRARTDFAALRGRSRIYDAADLPIADAERSGKNGARDHTVDSSARRSVAGSVRHL